MLEKVRHFPKPHTPACRYPCTQHVRKKTFLIIRTNNAVKIVGWRNVDRVASYQQSYRRSGRVAASDLSCDISALTPGKHRDTVCNYL